MTKKRPRPSEVSTQLPRLQRVLAQAGFGSRRQCEELIVSGRVEIDRQVTTELGTRVDPEQQQLRVDGAVVRLPRKKYFILNKPVGVISTARDPWARTRVIDLVDDSDRLFTVGRLDKASSGLILLTNDGDLSQRLTHPKYEVEKTYRAVVAGRPTTEVMSQLRQGLYLAEGKAHVERITMIRPHATKSLIEIVLREGKNREIRRLLARVGHKVQQLKRIALGPVRLGELPVGAYRELERGEVAALQQASRGQVKPARRRSSTGKKSSANTTPRAASNERRSSERVTRRSATVIGADQGEPELRPIKRTTGRAGRTENKSGTTRGIKGQVPKRSESSGRSSGSARKRPSGGPRKGSGRR